ncbi:MAG: hypothetical protein IKE76_12710 [Clostridia bacterium]|nr:hypothetical protein [Clostridia bacterium]
MDKENVISLEKQDVDKALLHALERGINDMENGQELPLKEAMDRVRRIRADRKNMML